MSAVPKYLGNWLTSPPVQKVCDAQRVEADKARWALEMLANEADRLGHFYMEIGKGEMKGGCIERKGGVYVVSYWIQERGFRDPTRFDTTYDSLLDALVGLTEDRA